MKIIHVLWRLRFGGIETMMINVANAQASLGHDVSLMIINEEWDESLLKTIDANVRLLHVGKQEGSGNPLFILRLNQMLRQEKPDVIHIHFSEIYSLIWDPFLSRKTCFTLHAIPYGEMRKPGVLYRLFPGLDIRPRNTNVKNIDRIPRVFAISQEVHDSLLNNYQVESTVIANGIPTASFGRRRKREASDPLRLVQVGRLEPKDKGQDLLIQAAARLQGSVKVDLIGTGSEEDELKKLVQKLQAEEWVRFLGPKSPEEVKKILTECDLLVQPSRREGFGLTVAEGMASGLPVLVSDDQGPAEVTCRDKYGWTFRNGNVEDLQTKIRYIMEHYTEALDKAEAAIQYVKKEYDVARTAGKYLEAYQDGCGDR